MLAFAAAASPVYAGTLVQGVTNQANNDDFTGDFGGDFNSRGFLSLAGFAGDQVFAVAPSGGTTEYLIRLSNIFAQPTDAVYVQLGFGVGDGFVSAASVLPELDFDAPLGGSPTPRSDAYPNVIHQPYTIQFSGGTAVGFTVAAAEVAIDVPDLPTSVNSYYAAEDLPSDLPTGAAVFTLRKGVGVLIPEPSCAALLAFGAAALSLIRKRGRQPRRSAVLSAARYCVALAAVGCAAATTNAGTIIGAVTGNPNSDNYGGSFAANPNRHSPGGDRIAALELVIPVADSGGTTEYSMTIAGGYSTEDGPITRDYRLQLGFGTGAGFVPAQQVEAALDFDTPLPATPAPQIAVFQAVKDHGADTLLIPGLAVPLGQFSSFFFFDMFRFDIDVPDLPLSVRDLYDPASLPADLPADAKAFTIRGAFVPEASTSSLIVAGVLTSAVARRARVV